MAAFHQQRRQFFRRVVGEERRVSEGELAGLVDDGFDDFLVAVT